jgi:hypothetical protein
VTETLRNVKSEEQWNEIKERPTTLVSEIPKKTKEYIEAVKKEPEPPTETTPALEKPSDSIHREILKTTPLSIKELKTRIRQFQKAWDNAKSARDSLCTTADLSSYKGGPETYEKITLLMKEGENEVYSMKELLESFQTFLVDYKTETEGIPFVGNESFESTRPPLPPEEEGQFGGVFQALVELRSKFTEYQEQLGQIKVTSGSIEEKLKKATEKLRTIRAKGPMTEEEKAIEENERTTREEFRKSPLVTECFPYNNTAPSSVPEETSSSATSTAIEPKVLKSLSAYKDLGRGTGLPPVEEKEEVKGDFPSLTFKLPPPVEEVKGDFPSLSFKTPETKTEPTTPAELVSNKAIGFQKVQGDLRQSPFSKMTKTLSRLTRRKTPLSSKGGQRKSRKRTLKKRRAGK